MATIKVAGFQANSFVDWPEKIASVVFLGGCNLRCHYCHNHNILGTTSNTIPLAEVLAQLRDQLGFTDGAVLTGGEPTLHPHLREIIAEIRALGLPIKLDTNGTNATLLKALINENLVDYVAMDIKGPLKKYPDITSAKPQAIAEIKKSLEFLKTQTNVDYMFRLTLSPMLTEADIRETARLVSGAKTFQLQQFVPNDYSNSHRTVHLPYTPAQAEKLAAHIAPHVTNFLMRGF